MCHLSGKLLNDMMRSGNEFTILTANVAMRSIFGKIGAIK
jgi:hypothetical protein